jgi:SSS family solute:Na+ symporter
MEYLQRSYFYGCFLIFSALTICYVFIGTVISHKVKSVNDYFLAGRNLGLFAVSLTLIATMIGGGALVGTSQDAYTYGYMAFSILLAWH